MVGKDAGEDRSSRKIGGKYCALHNETGKELSHCQIPTSEYRLSSLIVVWISLSSFRILLSHSFGHSEGNGIESGNTMAITVATIRFALLF